MFLLQTSLRISPPISFLPMGGVSRDSMKRVVMSPRVDQDQISVTNSMSPNPFKRWSANSGWANWDLLECPEDPFSIEKEARLHRQAAGKGVKSVQI